MKDRVGEGRESHKRLLWYAQGSVLGLTFPKHSGFQHLPLFTPSPCLLKLCLLSLFFFFWGLNSGPSP
jgi:hypothetical protein